MQLEFTLDAPNQEEERIIYLDPSELQPHPLNPRGAIKQDVVDSLAADMLANGFRVRHAIGVRPYNDGYQVFAGHTRRMAAIQAGIALVPCSIEHLDDREAYERMYIDNKQQNELDAFDDGRFVLNYGKGVGLGRGQEGGVSEAARVMGVSQPYAARLAGAAEIQERYTSKYTFLSNQTAQAYEIGKLTRQTRDRTLPLLPKTEKLVVEQFASDPWKQRATIQKIKELFEIASTTPSPLDPDSLCAHSVTNSGFSLSTVESLKRQIDSARKSIDARNVPGEIEEFEAWLINDLPELDYSPAAVAQYCETVLSRKRWPNTISISCADAIDTINGLESEIDALITDPPYGVTEYSWDSDASSDYVRYTTQWLTAAASKLAKNYNAIVFCDASKIVDTHTALIQAGLKVQGLWIWHKPNLAKKRSGSATRLINYEAVWHCGTQPLIMPEEWGSERFAVMTHTVPQSNHKEEPSLHECQKPLTLMREIVSQACRVGGHVVDPFCGSGTTALACYLENRNCTTSDINEKFVDIAKTRILGAME